MINFWNQPIDFSNIFFGLFIENTVCLQKQTPKQTTNTHSPMSFYNKTLINVGKAPLIKPLPLAGAMCLGVVL